MQIQISLVCALGEQEGSHGVTSSCLPAHTLEHFLIGFFDLAHVFPEAVLVHDIAGLGIPDSAGIG